MGLRLGEVVVLRTVRRDEWRKAGVGHAILADRSRQQLSVPTPAGVAGKEEYAWMSCHV
jgi:hypothetical protein